MVAVPSVAIDAAQAQLPSQTEGGEIAGCLAPPLALALMDGGLITCSLSKNSRGTLYSMGDVWSDAKTKGNIMKAVRALKLHVLKKTANITSEFLGAGSKTITMVFVLKKFPSNMKALPTPLPHPLSYPAEGLLVRTATGKKILSVTVGKGDMDVEALAKNAMAVTKAVCKSKFLDANLVREVVVDVDRLALPVWSRELWAKGKHGRAAKSFPSTAKRKGSMGPPVGLPSKKAKLI